MTVMNFLADPRLMCDLVAAPAAALPAVAALATLAPDLPGFALTCGRR
jgi:hypothetical protein